MLLLLMQYVVGDVHCLFICLVTFVVVVVAVLLRCCCRVVLLDVVRYVLFVVDVSIVLDD
jgi:hypothetical protein